MFARGRFVNRPYGFYPTSAGIVGAWTFAYGEVRRAWALVGRLDRQRGGAHLKYGFRRISQASTDTSGVSAKLANIIRPQEESPRHGVAVPPPFRQGGLILSRLGGRL